MRKSCLFTRLDSEGGCGKSGYGVWSRVKGPAGGCAWGMSCGHLELGCSAGGDGGSRSGHACGTLPKSRGLLMRGEGGQTRSGLWDPR